MLVVQILHTTLLLKFSSRGNVQSTALARFCPVRGTVTLVSLLDGP